MSQHTHKPQVGRSLIVLRLIVAAVVVAAVGTLASLGTIYAFSPAAIRQPEVTHYHFRLQLLVDGQPVDFGQEQFQTSYEKDNCSAAITTQPVHFHDGQNQFAHVHWKGITGGMVLKNYGWDVIGGLPGSLGWRFDDGLRHLVRVPIHGKSLPTRSDDTEYYVYVGSAEHYEQRTFASFTHEALPTFFHTTVNHAEHSVAISDNPTQAELAKLNNVIGSVIIFAQNDKPTEAEIKAQFEQLLPLPSSQCSG